MKATKLRWVAGLIIAGLLILAIVYLRLPARSQTLVRGALEWVASLGIWAPIIFIMVYTVACVFLIPRSILTLGAGALFGVLKGSVLASFSATLGATAAFLVGRYFARDWVAARIAAHAKLDVIDEAVAEEGWKIVFLTRLSPIFPFTLLNYAFGLTRVSLRAYVPASWLGMLPGTVLYVYLGSLAHAGARQTSTAEWGLRVVGLLATVIVTVVLTRNAKNALNKRNPA